MDEFDKLRSEKVANIAKTYTRTTRAAGQILLTMKNTITVFILFLIAGFVAYAELLITGQVGGGGKSAASILKSVSIRAVAIFMCSYCIYIVMADSGENAGKKTSDLLDALKLNNELRQLLTATKYDLHEFCKWYVLEDLRTYREELLASVSIDYDTWQRKYCGRNKKELQKQDLKYIVNDVEYKRPLTKNEIKVILICNNAKPIILSRNMLISTSAAHRTKHIFGMTGDIYASTHKIVKFATSAFISIGIAFVAIDFMLKFSWESFVIMLLRLLPMILNLFTGYMTGYKAFAVVHLDYLHNKNDLLVCAKNYFDIKENNNGNQIGQSTSVTNETSERVLSNNQPRQDMV